MQQVRSFACPMNWMFKTRTRLTDLGCFMLLAVQTLFCDLECVMLSILDFILLCYSNIGCSNIYND